MSFGLAKWLASSHVGASSRALAAATFGVVPDGPPDYPLDVSDIGRCFVLWGLEPEAPRGLERLAAVSGPWKRLSDNWSELLRLYGEDRDACNELVRKCVSLGSGSYLVRKGEDGRWDLFRQKP